MAVGVGLAAGRGGLRRRLLRRLRGASVGRRRRLGVASAAGVASASPRAWPRRRSPPARGTASGVAVRSPTGGGRRGAVSAAAAVGAGVACFVLRERAGAQRGGVEAGADQADGGDAGRERGAREGEEAPAARNGRAKSAHPGCRHRSGGDLSRATRVRTPSDAMAVSHALLELRVLSTGKYCSRSVARMRGRARARATTSRRGLASRAWPSRPGRSPSARSRCIEEAAERSRAVRADPRGAAARRRAHDPAGDARGDDRLADRHGARRPPGAVLRARSRRSSRSA